MSARAFPWKISSMLSTLKSRLSLQENRDAHRRIQSNLHAEKLPSPINNIKTIYTIITW